MEHDDEVDEESSIDPTEAEPGPRRSTFTPPSAPLRNPEGTDDDALADALAADLERIATGSISISAPGAVIPPGPAAASVVPPPAPVSWQQSIDLPAVPQPEPEPSPEPTPTAATTEPEPEAAPAPQAEPQSGYTPSAYSTPAWSGFPAPDPAQAVPLPDGPPVRKSLPDEELSQWVADAGDKPGGTLDIIEQLQNQMKLREEEAREFRAWEDRMRSLGTPDALGAVAEARTQFSGVLPEVPAAPATGSFTLPDGPVADWPAPDFAEPAAEPAEAEAVEAEPAAAEPEQAAAEPEPAAADPEPEPAAPAPAPQLPAWDVPAPSSSWAPPPDWSPTDPSTEPDSEPQADEAPPVDFDALAHAPAPEPATRAPFDWSPTAPSPVVTPEAVEAEPENPEPVTPEPVAPPAATMDAPFIEPSDSPSTTTDDDVVVPTIEPEPDAEAEDAEPEAELTVEPLPDTGPAPFSPPPLIEPGTFGGPPVLPSQTKNPTVTSFDAALAGPPEADEIDLDDEEDDSEPGSPAFDWTAPAPPPVREPVPSLDFDDLLAEEPPLHPDPEPTDATPEALFIEPMPLSAGEPIPTDTDSISVIDQAYDEELEDDVDETDRAFEGILGPVVVDAAGVAAAQQIHPPSGPISTMRIPEDEQVLYDDEPIRQPVFSIEDSDLEPTPVDHRVGRAARLFWLWFAANSSILSLGLGAAVFAVGMSLRQSIVAILAGVAISFLPLGLTTLAGKRSGQPTMVISRASFGLIGNVVPAIVALVTRLFWGAVLLWVLASSVAVVIVGAGLDGSLGERGVLLVSLAGAFLVAVLIAFAGYPMIARIQLVLSIISGILVVGLIALTYRYIDIPEALTVADGPWLLTITGAVLVFSFVGLVWANSGADLARYQRPETSGATSMLWATFGTALPSFLLIGYGALLAASDKGIASGFLLSPLDTLALMLPSWYPVPLIAATALSLLSGIILSLYSGGFALQSIGVRVKRQWSIVIVGVLLAGLALVLGFGVTGGINELFRDAATTLAVPTAAWAGIFAAETMIRNRRFEGQSLVRRGGVYADVRWVNLIGLIVFSAVGYGLTTATISWLSWQGYGFTLLGIQLDSDLAGTDLGVFAALVLGLLLPIVAGIPAVRKQEAMRAPE